MVEAIDADDVAQDVQLTQPKLLELKVEITGYNDKMIDRKSVTFYEVHVNLGRRVW